MLTPILSAELSPSATLCVRTLTDFCKQDCTDVSSYLAVLKESQSGYLLSWEPVWGWSFFVFYMLCHILFSVCPSAMWSHLQHSSYRIKCQEHVSVIQTTTIFISSKNFPLVPLLKWALERKWWKLNMLEICCQENVESISKNFCYSGSFFIKSYHWTVVNMGPCLTVFLSCIGCSWHLNSTNIIPWTVALDTTLLTLRFD